MTAHSPLSDGLPQGWRVATVAQVTSKVGSGATPRGGNSVYVHEGTALIRSQNVHDHVFRQGGLAYINDEAAEKLNGVSVLPGDVLMNITGDSILRCCLAPAGVTPARVNQHVAIIRSNGQLDSRLLQKWLTVPAMKEYMLGHSSGGTRKAVTKAHILSFPVPVPSPDEQVDIADTLEALDDKVQVSNEAIKTASELVDSIAQLFALDLPRVPLRVLANHSKQTVDPSGLGDILVDHFSLPAFDDTGMPERVPAGSILSNKLRVEGPTVLVSRLNPRIDRTWWARPEPGAPALASTEFLCLAAATQTALASVWLAVRDGYFRTELQRRVTGTSGSHQRVRPEDALNIDVPDFRLLDDERLQTTLGLLGSVHQKHLDVQAVIGARDELVPALLLGLIRVPGFQRSASAPVAS